MDEIGETLDTDETCDPRAVRVRARGGVAASGAGVSRAARRGCRRRRRVGDHRRRARGFQLVGDRVLPRAAKGRRRRDRVAEARVGVAEVAPRPLVVGRQVRRQLQLGDRLVGALGLEREQPQVAPHGGVVGRARRDLAIGRARLVEAPDLEPHQREQVQRAQVLGHARERAQHLGLGLVVALGGDQAAGAGDVLGELGSVAPSRGSLPSGRGGEPLGGSDTPIIARPSRRRRAPPGDSDRSGASPR